MAGTIITDKIQTENSFLTLNVGQTLVATINSSGILNSSGGIMVGANGSVSNTAITGVITASQLATSLNLATNNVQVASIQTATGTPAITFAANGQMTLANTPLQLTGGQIKFPSTKIASADANTLDDYEEGTWTPVYVASSGTLGSITYANREGKYTKIGNMVYISATFYTTAFAAGSGSGTLQIDGLPFTSHGNSAHSSYAMSDVRLFVTNNPSGARQVGTSTKITLYYRSSANGEALDFPVTSAGTGTNNLVTFAGCYTIS